MKAEAEFFSRFFALSLVEEPMVVEAIADYFKKTRILQDIKSNDIGLFQLKRALKCYKSQRKNLDAEKLKKIKWNFQFLRFENINFDISTWISFRKKAKEEDFLAILLGLVLKIDESLMLKLLKITPGTLRYRYNSGLSSLVEIKNHAKNQN